MKRNKLFVITCYTMFCLIACQDSFLDEKPNKALLVPSTLTDFRNLMDNLDVFNMAPSLPVSSSDDFIAANAFGDDPCEKNSYLWEKDIDGNIMLLDWNIPYEQVFYANVVLDGLKEPDVSGESQEEYNTVKGSALFHRSFAFYNLTQLFCEAYNPATANSSLGIPLRLEADVNQKAERGTLQETYDQILTDLKEAEDLLPVSSSFSSRPNKRATQALLARIYLNMEDYEQAGEYANTCLQQNDDLLDFNTLSQQASSPFPTSPATNNNPEIVFYSRLTSYSFCVSTRTTVDTILFKSYIEGDLRKNIFFNTTNPIPYFKGRYTGSTLRLFGGLANDELYLIKAECETRAGDYQSGIETLNRLLSTRWSNSIDYPLITVSNSNEALSIILEERQKELVFRGLRWGDLKRLNKDERFAKTLTRIYEGNEYTLLPNSPRYVFPIPTTEASLSGLEQNDR